MGQGIFEIEGFVSFGNELKKANLKNTLWMNVPF